MFSDVFTALKDGMQCIVFKVRDTFRPKMIAIKVFERKTLINLNIFEVFFKSCNSLKGNFKIKIDQLENNRYLPFSFSLIERNKVNIYKTRHMMTAGCRYWSTIVYTPLRYDTCDKCRTLKSNLQINTELQHYKLKLFCVLSGS